MMEGEGKMMGGGMNTCGCPHHKIVPMMIFIIGLLFLLNVLNVITAMALSWLWPIALMIAGLMKMMGGGCKCCRGGSGNCGGGKC
ncbi:MAG: hypothetical protein Q8R30_04940 [bacterium]|nr:hypothetical protein [bacterium]MDZ4286170.1 hypothetical protein [Candidatus Sungbacteria bacterium]